MQFTKEQLIAEVNYNLEHCFCSEKTKRLMEIALAILTSDPFAWADDAGIELLEMRYPAEVAAKNDDDFIFPLYRLPPLEVLK